MHSHCPLEVVAPFIALLLAFCCAPGALSAALTPTPSPSLVQPAATTAAECLEQPFGALSGALSIGQGQSGVPSIIFTLGSSAELYATDVWGTTETPLSLRTNPVAHMAASNAQLQGAAYSGGRLYLVFARNNGLGQSSVLEINQPWGGSPSFKFHPLGSVRVYDVVTSSKALYLLTQPKTVDWETHLLRFDLARGSYEGVRLPFSGGKVAITSDEGYVLAAGPSRNATQCGSTNNAGCTLTFTLDSVYLRQLASDVTLNSGGCEVHALAANPSSQLYMSSSGGAYCDAARFTGTLSDTKWVFNSDVEDFSRTSTWAVPAFNFWDGFVVGLGGLVSTTDTGLEFILQTEQQVNFGAPMLVTDALLGKCLVFPATACQDGNLSLYTFTLNQFTGAATASPITSQQ
ncbi:uncharacterized protein ACA1_018120 [Acanthamoeba castellanii str. Neff]|uniref:Uncharacterized protein n=1 Tax=Acanthamoeba castellanii (strain ATCC 30010 / Neff) TaxID=1257118 RepID=L8GLY8_ACACF|nr:uncharacterized protein ACA1_018120 [Acanthamoeba castellanii str. Neff]ELR13743.1 hypothetical protein ACA1_018120 [Acanthamoeba castellanii str. Neff]